MYIYIQLLHHTENTLLLFTEKRLLIVLRTLYALVFTKARACCFFSDTRYWSQFFFFKLSDLIILDFTCTSNILKLDLSVAFLWAFALLNVSFVVVVVIRIVGTQNQIVQWFYLCPMLMGVTIYLKCIIFCQCNIP